MKKLLFILILILISSCGSNKNTLVADKKFELCSDIRYERLISNFNPLARKSVYKRNIHSLFENLLIREGYLTEVNKAGYRDLLNKVRKNKVDLNLFEKFKTYLGFDPQILFPTGSFTSCYTYMIENLGIMDEDSWQYKFRDAYWKFEAEGNLRQENDFIFDALKVLPEKEFQDINYRKLFLDLIFLELEPYPSEPVSRTN
jgi:hypothetical protein